MTTDNVIPFRKRPRADYNFTADGYLWLILKGLSRMFGDDDHLKSNYIAEHCPHLSMAMLERFQKTTADDCNAFYRKKGGKIVG